jgi:hypothetical protein
VLTADAVDRRNRRRGALAALERQREAIEDVNPRGSGSYSAECGDYRLPRVGDVITYMPFVRRGRRTGLT